MPTKRRRSYALHPLRTVVVVLGMVSTLVLALRLDASPAYRPPPECRGARPVFDLDGLTDGSDPGPIRIVRPIVIDQSITVPATLDLCFMMKGRLVLEDAVEVEILGAVHAGPWQIFEYRSEASAVTNMDVAFVLPEWWGAIANDPGNDTSALRAAGRFLTAVDGGRIEFQRGAYIVGEQFRPDPSSYRVERREVFLVTAAQNPVVVSGNGARLVAASGLRFGYFDPTTGEPQAPASCGAGSPYAANAYTMLDFVGNADVTVRDLELDGNIFGLELGAACSDGRQLFAYGIRAYNNQTATFTDIHTHHHGLDGIVIGFDGISAGDPPTPHTLTGVVSEYNARQGLSWVGGIGLTATDSRFNHTGRARFSSPPGAGVDVEAEDAVVRDGLFVGCEFVNNTGAGFISDSGDGGYTTVRDSTVWGTTFWSVFARNPAMVFEDSRIYGAIPNAYGSNDPSLSTRFSRCHFEDLHYQSVGVFRSNALIQLDGENNVIEDSTIVANETRGLWLDGSTTREIVRNTTVLHRDGSRVNGDFQSLLRGALLENVHFHEDITPAPAPGQIDGWYIAVEPNVTYNNVCVDGPWVKWGNPILGATGCPIP